MWDISEILKGAPSEIAISVLIVVLVKLLITERLPFWMRFTGFILALGCIMWIFLRAGN